MNFIKGKYINIVFMFLLSSTACLKISTIDNVYQKGVDAYKGERWSECIIHFEESLHLYKLYRMFMANCRHQCNNNNYKSFVRDDIEDLKIFEKYFNKRNCLIDCQEKAFEDIHIHGYIKTSLNENMKTGKPYGYIQLCYYQTHDLSKAASAAYTYFVLNPDDHAMKENVLYYGAQAKVDPNDVVDLESEDFEVLYRLGIKAYNKMNWGETIASMEEVLTDYLTWENHCRAECGEQSIEATSEFVLTVSDSMSSLVDCHQKCQNKVKSLDYDSGVQFLSEILNYLQVSYHKMDRNEDAAATVATFLAMLPNDKDMLDNKEIYITLVEDSAFAERSEIIYYYKRDQYEKQLINFFRLQPEADIGPNSIGPL